MLSRLVFILILILPVHALQAEDTLISVMQRMQSRSAVKIAYQETRYLQLMAKPWLASGYLYALPADLLIPNLLIKEQQLPSREIMGANGDKIYYYDPINDVRYSGVINKNDPISLNVAAFQALVTGNLQLLEKMYNIVFSAEPKQWLLTLTSHADNEVLITVIITGLVGQPANKIVVHQADGDRSEFTLAPAEQGDKLAKSIRKLKRELMGE